MRAGYLWAPSFTWFFTRDDTGQPTEDWPDFLMELATLEWAIGDWADEGENGQVARVSFEWSETQNFILDTFAASFKNIEVSGGTQTIGWDPIKKQIRSWTFDEDGGAYNQADAGGFIKLNALRMRIATIAREKRNTGKK